MTKLKPIEIGYGDNKYIFHLRMISVAEEDDIARNLRDVSETEKYKREYEIILDALSEFKFAKAQKLGKEKGEFVSLDVDLKAEFAERSPANERLIRDVWFLFKSQLSPESRFLDS